MDIIVLDPSLIKVAVFDIVDSLIWTDRYDRCGDFEISTKVTTNYLQYLKENNYIQIKDSEHMMIIESAEIETNIETGNKLIVKGRSLESIIDRRIVWEQTILSGNIESAIERLLNENVISPIDPDRAFGKFIFEPSEDDYIHSISIDRQYMGDNLYEVIQKLCEDTNIGFKITLNANKDFVFKLYSGKNRSYNQSDYPPIIFSPSLDNISNTKYFYSNASLKTNVLVAGEGISTDRLTIQIKRDDTSIGINRREVFADASDLSMTITDGTLDLETYVTLLAERGYVVLLENSVQTYFEGLIVPSIVNYILGVDFQIGDIVQTENEYKLTGSSRVTEIIFSEDLTGSKFYPTFKAIN